jgi:hypothetical protein
MNQYANIPVTAKFPAFVVSVQGTNPGPASGITYTLDINMPNSGPLRVAGVAPANSRPPEDMDTRAVAPNTFCEVWFIGGRIHACIYEFPAWGAC